MKRSIEVSSRGTRLYLQDSRLQVCREDETLASIPVEDLALVILATTGVGLSSGVLKALGEAGAAVLACDDSYHPCGIFLPMAANALHSERARLQAEASAPLRKNLWARIVKAKIANQAANLDDGPARTRLLDLADKVRSGDEGNREGQAARVYWPAVFTSAEEAVPRPFQRFRDGPPPNNLLNYGYSVLRAATARALCVAGLQPMVGIHHRNRYSGFCLADDLMEPFRPFVDRTVLSLVLDGKLAIDKDTKGVLIGTLASDVRVGSESLSMGLALERAASSMAKAFERQVKGGEAAPTAAESLILPAGQPRCH